MTEHPEWRGQRQGHRHRGEPALLGLEARSGLAFYSQSSVRLSESPDTSG